jgi:hypothetical protein
MRRHQRSTPERLRQKPVDLSADINRLWLRNRKSAPLACALAPRRRELQTFCRLKHFFSVARHAHFRPNPNNAAIPAD